MTATGQDGTAPICPPGHVRKERVPAAEELGQGVHHQEIS